MINVGSDFSGVGAFDQALIKLGIDYNTVYACDWDKYARQTYIDNYGKPYYFPEDVYNREIPKQSLDIYMSSPPCQTFSIAGKRKGQNDHRGILFYNTHEFIQQNKPRYFIIENVKGLLSDDNGRTFKIWLEFLGGKSVNGNTTMFPANNATPYHVYYKVLNAKHYGVPQNRERVFIIGVRDDADNVFSFPKPVFLYKRLKDVLENDVAEKYFLSDKMIAGFTSHSQRHTEKGTGFGFAPKSKEDTANCLRANAALAATDNMIIEGDLNKGGQRGVVYSQNSKTISCLSATDYKQPKQIKVGTKENNISVYGSLTGGKWDKTHEHHRRVYNTQGVSPTIHTMGGGNQEPKIIQKSHDYREDGSLREYKNYSPCIAANMGDNLPMVSYNNKRLNKTIEKNGVPKKLTLIDSYNQTYNTEYSHTISTRVSASNETHLFVKNPKIDVVAKTEGANDMNSRIYNTEGIAPTLNAGNNGGGQSPVKHFTNDYKIRKLTPRECFRLMSFPDTFTWTVSNSQAYKQAGNSIVVDVLAAIISKLKL